MKRILAALLAALLLLTTTCALAESADVPEGCRVPEDTPVAADLDGDGASERVSWAMVPGDSDPMLTLSVETADGETLTYPTDIIWNQSVYILDLDGDGVLEILMTGDVMSDDYYTVCLHLVRGALYEVLFPDSERGENTQGYYKSGYGLIKAIDGNHIALAGSQDVLGTWFATRTVALSPAGRFEFDDDGLWRRDALEPDDEAWQYAALTTSVELPCADAAGNPGVLAPGTQLIVVASDKRESAAFVTRDGVSGTLSISPDYERGWGWLVDGVAEDQCFEYIPYAD